MSELAGRVAVVTGAAAGIGCAVAQALAAADVASLIVELLADESAGGRIVYWESGDEAPRVVSS